MISLVHVEPPYIAIRTSEDSFSRFAIGDAQQIASELATAIPQLKAILRERAERKRDEAEKELEKLR